MILSIIGINYIYQKNGICFGQPKYSDDYTCFLPDDIDFHNISIDPLPIGNCTKTSGKKQLFYIHRYKKQYITRDINSVSNQSYSSLPFFVGPRRTLWICGTTPADAIVMWERS